MAEKTEKKQDKKKKGKREGSAPKLQTGTVEKITEPPRLKKFYREQVVPSFIQELGKENPNEVPRLTKVVVNIGLSEAKDNIQVLDTAREALAQITGQLPQVRRAKKSISNFKLRAGSPIGIRVTLRGDRMYEFVDRLMSTAVPRIRDFRGLEPKGFDGQGNYNLGLREHHIFPEIKLEKTDKSRGMNITFVTTARTDQDGLELLGRMGMPFKKPAKKKE